MKTGTKILAAVGGSILLILMQDNLWLILMVMVGAAVLTGLGLGLRELHRQENTHYVFERDGILWDSDGHPIVSLTRDPDDD